MRDLAEISQTLRDLRARVSGDLTAEEIDEMALPSYLDGNWLSRKMAWGKLQVIIRAAEFSSEDVLLDFGCGTGILLALIHDKVKRILATDINPRVAELLVDKLKIANVEFLQPEDVPQIPQGTVTKIVAANVLEHVPDVRSLSGDFARILNPGCRLVVAGPTESLLYRFGRWIVGFSGDYHVRTIMDILQDIESTGNFTERSRSAFPLPAPFCLYRVASFARR